MKFRSIVELQGMMDEPAEVRAERLEKFRREAVALISIMTGKTFDPITGRRVYSEAELAARREAEANASKRGHRNNP